MSHGPSFDPRESDIRKKIYGLFVRLMFRYFATSQKGSHHGNTTSTPDIFVQVCGPLYLAVEVKRPSGGFTNGQAELAENGDICVVRSDTQAVTAVYQTKKALVGVMERLIKMMAEL